MNTLIACATCFGAPGHQTTDAIAWAILFLLAVLAGMLGGIIAVFAKMNKRARLVAAGETFNDIK